MNINKFFISTHADSKYKVYSFEQNFIILGSASDSQLVLHYRDVGERHCRIENRDNTFILRDLRSTSGTFLNGSKIIEAILQEGDNIQLGDVNLTFHLSDPNPLFDIDLKSQNLKWQTHLNTLPFFAKTLYPVLILGPSGTGKEIIAKKIHEKSERNQGPFLSVNCSALTETLIESELFGHVKGSFTGAISDRKGAFESARGGTLFLDEIGDLPYGLQAKLLRALENKEIRPVGSDKIIQTDVRIIAATHQKLRELINNNKFRADLYYRLNVIHFHTPSLKERMEDFDDIFYSICREFRIRFNFESIQELKNQDWPGNIRELKNIIARAAAMYPLQTITEHMISSLLDEDTQWKFNDPLNPHDLSSLPSQQTGGASTNIIKEIERQMILTRLEANKGNQRRTAHDLGIPKSTLHDRIRTYNIDLSVFKNKD